MSIEAQAEKRGLSDTDRAEIERLASAMKNPTPSRIAHRIGAHPATVNWFMITNGLITRKVKYGPRLSWVRGGVTLYAYTREHDERICELRREGKDMSEIAAIVTADFGIKRSDHGIDVRLKMLAAYEGGPEQ